MRLVAGAALLLVSAGAHAAWSVSAMAGIPVSAAVRTMSAIRLAPSSRLNSEWV